MGGWKTWLGILIGLMFVIWCISGIVLMYAGIPHITAGERLYRLPALDLSTVSVTPAQVVAPSTAPNAMPACKERSCIWRMMTRRPA